MRRLYPIVVAAVLLPAAAAAQRVPPVIPISQTQASTVAVTRVRTDLAAGKLSAWGGGTGGGIRPTSVTVSGALFNPTGGKDGTPIYVVGVDAPNAAGHVRVIIDARSGAVVDARISTSWDWGNSPDWWVKGLNSPPPARTM